MDCKLQTELEYCEIFKSNVFYRTDPVAAFGLLLQLIVSHDFMSGDQNSEIKLNDLLPNIISKFIHLCK